MKYWSVERDPEFLEQLQRSIEITTLWNTTLID